MFIYNVTTKVDRSAADDWLHWMVEVHIPAIMKTGCFEKCQFAKLLETDESDGYTFVVQYYAISKANYNRYLALHAPALRKEVADEWGNKLVSFRTLMEVVDETTC
jgi:predicted GTPase